MLTYSTEIVCGLTGVLPTTLRNWRRAGLINYPESTDNYSCGQLTRIRTILALSGSGSTLHEIHAFLAGLIEAPRGSWECRQEEMHAQLRKPSNAALYSRLRQMGRDYCGDDFVNSYLRPLNLWLRSDHSEGASERLVRFHDAVILHAKDVMRAAGRRKSVPVFLEAVTVTDPTEIWLEAIRLTGQGCRVEISSETTGLPASASLKKEHHLMWCGAGISQLMQWNYREKLRNSEPVMLSGPDQELLLAA